MRCVLTVFVALFLCVSGSWGQSEQETRERLEALQQKLTALEKALQQDKSAHAALRRTLRDDEVTLGQLNRDIELTKQTLQDQQRRLKKLETQQQSLRQSSQQQKKRVMKELRQAYQMGQEGGMKALLNQDQPEALARVLAYHGYIYRARTATIERYRETLKRLEQVVVDIRRVQQRLEQNRQALSGQRENLTKTRARRQQTLADLSASIASKGAQRKELERNRSELENLLKTIEKAVIALAVPDNYKPFSALKGKMPWPLVGRHLHRFGQSRNRGKMRWQGVTIPAAGGTKVKPVHYGQVVFADWFRGSGLLLIVDHGDGFMSLYAHNQSLLAEVGEWVTPETAISTVGNSGGQESTALYFEIRQQGKPVNPARWCGKIKT